MYQDSKWNLEKVEKPAPTPAPTSGAVEYSTETKELKEKVDAAKQDQDEAKKKSAELTGKTKKKEAAAAAAAEAAAMKVKAAAAVTDDDIAMETNDEDLPGVTAEPTPDPTPLPTMSDLCATTEVENTHWSGVYNQYGQAHKMVFDFNFDPANDSGDGNVEGSGEDNVGSFSWSGHYHSTHVNVTKAYLGKWKVLYYGELTPEDGGLTQTLKTFQP